MTEPRLRFLSLGGGVQSTTLALKAERGEIGPKPDCAIMAQTWDEGSETYEHMKWLRLSEALFAGDDQARIPAFVAKGGLAKRQCTRNFKIRVIRREVRNALGVGARSYIAPGSVEQWIGISTDEAHRMKPTGVRFMTNRWPLIEAGMSRRHCAKWLWDEFGIVAPKSSCVFCCFQSNDQWEHRRVATPPDFAAACDVDKFLRSPKNVARFHGELFLHPSLRPLAEIDFGALIAAKKTQPDLFGNECEAACGL